MVLTRVSVTCRAVARLRSLSVWILDVVAIVLALAAGALAVVALRRQAAYRRTPGTDALPQDVTGLRQEVAEIGRAHV